MGCSIALLKVKCAKKKHTKKERNKTRSEAKGRENSVAVFYFARRSEKAYLTFCGGREHKTATFFLFFFISLTSIQSEFNSRRICHHLTRWNKRDKFGSSPNSFFKWRQFCSFRCRSLLLELPSGCLIDSKHFLGYVHAALDAVGNSCV